MQKRFYLWRVLADGGSADARVGVQPESLPARALVATLVVGADLGAIVSKTQALVHVDTLLGVLGVDDPTFRKDFLRSSIVEVRSTR